MTDNYLKKLIAKAKRLQVQLEQVKPMYSELDQITAIIVKNKSKAERHGVKVVDNFALRNTQFKVAHFKRFDLRFLSHD